MIIVIHEVVKILRVTGDGIEQQILSNELAAVGYDIVGRVIAVHGLIHALEQVGDRLRFADMRLPIKKSLQRCDGVHGLGIFQAILALPLYHEKDGAGSAEACIQRGIIFAHHTVLRVVTLDAVVYL